MLVSEFLTRLNYALRGTDDDTPDIGSDEANYWLSTFNRVKDQLYRKPSMRLADAFNETTPNEPGTVATTGTTTLTGTNTYFTDYRVGDKITVDGETERTIATITSDTSLTVTVAFSNTASGKTFARKVVIATGVKTYNLHRNFIYASDTAYVTLASGDEVYFDLIKPQERNNVTQELFVSGVNPKVLNFSKTIESTDSIVGGTLVVPGYYLPADVSAATDEIPLIHPDWGVLATATEIAFNDVVYEEKAPDLNAKANAEYATLKALNEAGSYGNPRRPAYRGYRIGQRTKR